MWSNLPEVSIHASCSGSPHRGLSVSLVPMEPINGSVAAIISRLRLMRWRKCQGLGVRMPFCIGRSVNWPAVWAHRMGLPFSRMTAELLRDAAQARRRPRTAARNMTEELGLPRGMESRAPTQDWGLPHWCKAYVHSVHTHVLTHTRAPRYLLTVVHVTGGSVDPRWQIR